MNWESSADRSAIRSLWVVRFGWEIILPRTESLAGSTRRGRRRCDLRLSAFRWLAGRRRQTRRSLRRTLDACSGDGMEQGCGRFLQACERFQAIRAGWRRATDRSSWQLKDAEKTTTTLSSDVSRRSRNSIAEVRMTTVCDETLKTSLNRTDTALSRGPAG